MKQRLLVMNGSRIVQAETATGEWENQKVDKAHGVKPGVYNLYLSKEADKTKAHTGVIIHSDKNTLYQQVDKGIVTHNRNDFVKDVPDIGLTKTLSYDVQGKAVTVDIEAASIKKGLKR